MSVYKEIRTEYKTSQSLVKALLEVGLELKHSPDFRANTLTTTDMHGNSFQVALLLDRESLQARSAYKGVRIWGGVGFAWNGRSYDMVVDDLDAKKPITKEMLNQIKQRYTYHEIKRQAWAKGYTVQEQKASDGTIRLQLRSVK
jgi:hypothetical protein